MTWVNRCYFKSISLEEEEERKKDKKGKKGEEGGERDKDMRK